MYLNKDESIYYYMTSVISDEYVEHLLKKIVEVFKIEGVVCDKKIKKKLRKIINYDLEGCIHQYKMYENMLSHFEL